MKIKFIMHSHCVWTVIEGNASVDEDTNQGTLTAASQCLPDAMMMAIAEKEAAKLAWEAIKQMRICEDPVKKVTNKR